MKTNTIEQRPVIIALLRWVGRARQMQLNIFYACKIFSPNIKYFCSGSERAGADAGAGGQEPEQHRGQPVAEAGERGLGLQPRQHCEYYRHSTVQYSTDTICNVVSDDFLATKISVVSCVLGCAAAGCCALLYPATSHLFASPPPHSAELDI